MGQAHLTAEPRDLPMAAPIAANSAGHSLASASAASVVEVGGLAVEHEGEDALGVGHGRGSPGKGDTVRDTPVSQTRRPKKNGRGWPEPVNQANTA